MGHPRRCGGRPGHGCQRGQALLIFLAILGVGFIALLFSLVSPASLSIASNKATVTALAQAKEALIGRAVSDNNRPGSLPCPDFDDGTVNAINVPNDGVADVMVGNNCPSYVGRLPWKTLGLPDLRDSDGERLWYALSNNFRDHTTAEPINNDTKGNRTVYSESTATTLTTEAVAVVFAPGASLGAQIRDAALALCPTTGTTIARNLCAANYLDSTGGVNNAAITVPQQFISAPRSDTFNDRVLVVTTADLMPVVERRVARQMLTLLQSYRAASACACYPWAANNFDDDSVAGRTRGGVPIENALPEVWGAASIPSVPGWIPDNNWGHKNYYAVAPSETATHLPGTLTVDAASKNVVLITTGPAGASRPSLILTDYVDDVENSNNDDVFQTPSSTAYARDRLYTIP